MKKIVFPFLGVLILVFSGCMKTEPPSTDYTNVPAIVTLDYTTFHYMLATSIGTFYAPELSSEYGDGDAIWIDFTYDEGNQPYQGVYTASNLKVYGRVSMDYAREAPEDMTDDYTAPIDAFFTDITAVNKILFFGFQQKAKTGQTFTYEMLYKQDSDTPSAPTLYLKSRVLTEGTGSEAYINTPFGFDMNSFISKYKTTDKDYVSFYIKVYTGTDADGNDVYKSATTEPIPWVIIEQ